LKVQKTFFPIRIVRFRSGPAVTGGYATESFSLFSLFSMPQVAKNLSHQHRGAGGMFASAQPLPEAFETDSDNDGADILWENDMEPETEQEADYFEAWEMQPKPWTYDERVARRLEKQEKALAKRRAAEMRSAENGTWQKAKDLVDEGLRLCPLPTIRRFYRRADRYASVYRLGATGPIAEFAVRKYRSHRGVCAKELDVAMAEWKAKAEAMAQGLSRRKGKSKQTAK
jgi:hypothetical protein